MKAWSLVAVFIVLFIHVDDTEGFEVRNIAKVVNCHVILPLRLMIGACLNVMQLAIAVPMFLDILTQIFHVAVKKTNFGVQSGKHVCHVVEQKKPENMLKMILRAAPPCQVQTSLVQWGKYFLS